MKMKKIAWILIAAAEFAGTAPVARAGDEGWAALGGFIAGSIVTSIKHQNNYGKGQRYRGSYRQCDTYRDSRSSYHKRPSGHYEYRSVKTWISGRWIYETDECGYTTRYWKPSHYVYRKTRVWVDHYRGDHYATNYRRRY